MACQFLLDVDALAVRAVVFLGPRRIGGRLESLVVDPFDVGEIGALALFVLIGQIIGLELGRIEEEATALGARRGPGNEGGPRQRIVVAGDFRFARGAAGGETGAIATAAGAEPRPGEQQPSRQNARESMHCQSPVPARTVPRNRAASIGTSFRAI